MSDYTKVTGLEPQSIIDSVIQGTDIPSKRIENYTKAHLTQICFLLIRMIQELILSKLRADITGDVQEWLDTLTFQAKMDSGTSSLRPSSDLYGSRHRSLKDEKDESESAACSEEDKEENNGSESTDPNSSPTVQEKTDEEKSEEALRKDHKRSRRTPLGLKPGKQPKAKGFGFVPPEQIDHIYEHTIQPEGCKGCSQWEECKKTAKTTTTHNTYDFEIHIVKHAYKPVTVACPNTSEKMKSVAPEEASGTNQYGLNIKVWVAMLYTFGMVSFNRIKEMLGPVLGMKLSPATMLKFIQQLAGKVKETVDAILEAEKLEKVVHCDETGAKADGKIQWIHCIATELYTFVSIQERRGKDGMDSIGFLTHYVGTVVHDCWSSYFKYANCLHAICNAHIERELAGVSKFFKDANKWADDMLKLLQSMLHEKHEAQKKNLKSLPADVIDAFSTQFDALIARGKEIHKIPEKEPGKRGRTKRGRARALIDRMEERKTEIFRFIVDFDVPYTNNTAEASFRLLGLKRSVGIFRDIESARNFCMIWSYVATARKHKVSAYDAIREAYLGNAMQVIFPNGVPKREDKTDSNQQDSIEVAAAA